MSQNFKAVAEYWQAKYSNQIKSYQEYSAKEQLQRFANLFTMGESYYYVLNMHNLELDFVSDSVQDFVGIPGNEVTMMQLLQMALPEELELVQQKERIINDFFTNYCSPKERLEYKILYPYKMKDHKGKLRTILLQSTVLSLSENGDVEHVFAVHSDITFLKTPRTDRLSFFHMYGGPSYYNLSLEGGVFQPKKQLEDASFAEIFTPREKEIITALGRGLSTKEIAARLNLSPHTVRTHRKNILDKSGCANSAELVYKSLLCGVVDVTF